MTENQSVLAAQRAEDEALCWGIRQLLASHGPMFVNPGATIELTNRIEQLNSELAEASHDRDRYHADCERLQAELATRPRIVSYSELTGEFPTED